MKGLVLKDYYNLRITMLLSIALMLFPSLAIAITGGNIGDEAPGAMTEFVAVMVYGMMNYMTITLFSGFIMNTIGDDERTGWAKMQRAMPVSGGQIMGGKLIAMALIIGMLTGLTLIVNITGIIFYDLPTEPLFAIPFIVALMQVITLSLCLMLGYRISTKVMTPVFLIIEVIVAAGVIAMIIQAVKENVSMTAVRVTAYAVIPVLAAAAVAVSYKLGKKSVMKDM